MRKQRHVYGSVIQSTSLLLVFLISSAVRVFAALTGDIQGTVFDPKGLAVSDAKVTIRNVDTGATRQLMTGSLGEFSVLQLPVGSYEVRVERQGFRTFSAVTVVKSGEPTPLKVTLELGRATDVVTVEGGLAPVLDISTAQMSISVDPKTISELPNSQRDPMTYATLSPGVIPVTPNNPFLGSGSFNTNGQRGRGNNITIDNITATDISTTGSSGLDTISLDAIQEFKLITNNFSAEFGRNASAQAQIITKGGTNEFHGTAHWFHQNAYLNARDYFDTTGQATPLIRNLWGATGGGPILKDRTFFYGHYEGLKVRGAGDTRAATVMTPAQAAAITDPTSRAVFTAVGAPTSPTGSLINSAPNKEDEFRWSLRVDHSFREGKDSIAARFGQDQDTAATPSLTFIGTNLANQGATNVTGDANFNLSHTHILNPTVTNQFRFAFGRSSPQFPPNTTLTAPFAPWIRITGLASMGVSRILPQGRIQNTFQYSDVVSWAKGRHSLKFGGDVYRYQANSFFDADFRGNVLFASVADFQAGLPTQFDQRFGTSVRGNRSTDVFSFFQDDVRVTSVLTLNLGARLESSGGVSEVNGLLSNLNRNRSAPLGGGGTGPLGTIDLGGTSFGRNYNWAPRFGFAWNPNHNKLVVRGGYGWAYDYIFLNPITNLRFAAPFIPSIGFRGPFTGANSWANLIAGTATVQSQAVAAIGSFPATQTNFGNLSPVDQNLKNPRAGQWSLGVEYQVVPDLAVKAAYVGVKGDFLEVSVPVNLLPAGVAPPPATSEADEFNRRAAFNRVFTAEQASATGSSNRIDPRFNAVSSVQSAGSSIYHSLELEVIKRLRQGYGFQASYTYGHSIDNASDVLDVLVNDSPNFQDPRNLRDSRGSSEFDIRHRFVLSHVWELRWGKKFSGPARRVLDGWALSGIFQTQSGFPANIFGGTRRGVTDVLLAGASTVRASGSVAGFTPAPQGSPTAALIPAPCSRGVVTQLNAALCFNTSSFSLTQPLLGNPGTLGRNVLRLNRFTQYDLTIRKDTKITERQTIQFRLEAFNLFNQHSFAGFVNGLTSPNFGLYQTTDTNSRRLQVALKYIF